MTDFLSEEELSVVLEDGLLLPGSRAGKYRISASYMSTFPPPEAWSSTDSTSSITCTAFDWYRHSQGNADFPSTEHSVAALEYIGLQTATAIEIFDRWQSRRDADEFPEDLIDYVWGHICEKDQVPWQANSDAEALHSIGVAPWLCSVLLNPASRDVLQTRTLRVWLNEIFRKNYKSIDDIEKQLKAYVKHRTGGKGEHLASHR